MIMPSNKHCFFLTRFVLFYSEKRDGENKEIASKTLIRRGMVVCPDVMQITKDSMAFMG